MTWESNFCEEYVSLDHYSFAEVDRLLLVSAAARLVYGCVVDYVRDLGYPPSLSEIGYELEISKSNAYYLLKQLESVGLVSRMYASPRAITLLHRR